MKILIASDIHGSLYYCKKLIERIESEKVDKVVFLGDILYHGPRNDLPKDYNPKGVIELLNNLKVCKYSVRGNCDSEVDQMVLKFPIMADYSIIDNGYYTIFATHGHIYNESNLPPLDKLDILLCGHTHVPKCIVHNDFIYMNTGSVSIPKEESYNGYIVIENNFIYWKDLDGNIINTYIK